MNKNIKTILGLIIAVLAVWGIYSISQKPSEPISTEPIKIGVVLSLSGYGARDAESIKQGLDLAQKDLNSKGKNISLIYQDDATDPKRTISAVQQLTATGVDALVGIQWSYLLQAVLPIINVKQITFLGPSITSEIVNMPSDYVFYAYIKNEKKINPLAEWFIENQIKSPAFFVNNIAWGENHIEVFSKAIEKAGGKSVLVDKINFGSETDTLPTLILKAKNLGADAILWAGSTDGAFLILKKLNDMNMEIPFIADENIVNVFAQDLITEGNKVATYTFDKGISEEFRNKFKEVYGTEPRHYADSAYDSLMILVEAIINRGQIPLNEYMKNISYEGYNTTYSFDENGDVDGGSWKIIKLQ